jgi:serine/threonine protein kinase
MGATAAVHPTDQILQSYGLGKLDDASSVSVSKHLEGCDSCQRRVAELSSDDFLGRLRNAQIKPDKSATSWSPSAASSTEGTPSPVVPPPPTDTLPPELVDHPDYKIVRELGRGGMGVVYLANNKLMGRQEVLKVVGRHLVERPGVGDRFLREIRSAAKLHHPNIVTAHSAIRLGESLVLAMEYVEGLDLAKMVKTKGALPIAHACYFIHQAALGLQHAHERGMVHRDIKPANLILARDGKKPIVKVLDFGLAKVTSEGQTDSGLTREGQMLGTPDYIAPEQIRNAQSADIRADIYSLGCTFYYILTGGPPFRGDHLWDVYQAHFSMDAGPLNLVRPEVPVELAAVVAKMMAKEPGRRFQTPGEVARALTPFFKPAATQPVVGNTDVSQVPPPITPTQISGTRLSSTEPETASPPALTRQRREPSSAAFPWHKQQAASAEPETRWESLIEIKETERLEDPAPAIIKTAPQKPKWLWPAVAACLVLTGLIVASGVVVRSKTPEGTIVLENVPQDAVVEIDGDKITVTPTGGEPVRIEVSAAKHALVVRRGDLVLLAESVTLEAGKEFKHKLSARLESPVVERPEKTETPDAKPPGARIQPSVAEQPEKAESPATKQVPIPPVMDLALKTEYIKSIDIWSEYKYCIDQLRTGHLQSQGFSWQFYESNTCFLAKNAFGRTDALLTHPFDGNNPATIDFSKITKDRVGELVLIFHSFPDRAFNNGVRIVVKVDNKTFANFPILFDEGWKAVKVPFDRIGVLVEQFPIGWSWEYAFTDFVVKELSTPPKAGRK